MKSGGREGRSELVQFLRETLINAATPVPFWRVSSNLGSLMFFEAGTPSVSVSERVRQRPFGTRSLPSRSASVFGNLGFSIQMANWATSFRGEPIAHSESSRDEIRALCRWLEGQSLVGVELDQEFVCLEFDLGASFRIHPYEDAEPDEIVVSAHDASVYTTWHANGIVVVEPRSLP